MDLPAVSLPKSWRERGVPVQPGPLKALESTTQFTAGKTEIPEEGEQPLGLKLNGDPVPWSWEAWIPGTAEPLISSVALSVVGSLLPLEMNACLPGCVSNATPRSLSPLERNSGFSEKKKNIFLNMNFGEDVPALSRPTTLYSKFQFELRL